MENSPRFKLFAILKDKRFSSSRYLDEVKITDARITISRLRLDMHSLKTCYAQRSKTGPAGQTCPCGSGPETVEHFLLHCSRFDNYRCNFERRISEISQGYMRANNSEKLRILLNVEPRVRTDRWSEAVECIAKFIKTVYAARRLLVG